MGNFEADALLEAFNFQYCQAWERTRLISYYIACSVSTEKIEITSMMPFSWDKKKKKKKPVPLAEVQRLKQRALDMEQKINKANGS